MGRWGTGSSWRTQLARGVVISLVVSGVGFTGLGERAEAAEVLPNVNVTQDADSEAEGSIAIDPTNPLRLFAASNINVGSGLYAARSTNAGVDWTGGVIADGSGELEPACCDPSASWDSFGNLFLVYLDNANDAQRAIRLLLSTNGGASFTELANLESNNVDQPTVTTGSGSVWVTWQSEDGRISASGAQVTGQGDGEIGEFSTPQQAGEGNFGDIAIGPDGQVMVTYQRPHDTTSPSALYTALDSDGLGSGGFGAEREATDVNMAGFTDLPAQPYRSVDAEVDLAWDRTGGPNSGRVYLVYTNRPTNSGADTNIFVRRSDNDGADWSGPVRVNDDDTDNSQLLPRAVVDQTNGRLAVSFHDARNSDGNDTTQFFATTSADGTSFDANQRISEGTSNASTADSVVDYGDYIGLDYRAGSFYPYWADNSNSTGDNPDGANQDFDMYTSAVVVSRRPTDLVYTGPTVFTPGESVTLSARLTDERTGTALPDQPVAFELGSASCTGTTDPSGSAECTVTVPSDATEVVGRFAGNDQYEPSSTSEQAEPRPTELTYTGPTEADYNDPFTASARLTTGDGPVSDAEVDFTLGSGGGSQVCSGTTNSSGVASCSLTPTQAPGETTMTARFAGTDVLASSSDSVTFTITRQETAAAYTGPERVANGTPAELSGVLTEETETGPPIEGRTLTLALGTGVDRQACTGTTNAAGVARCTIQSVDQPLNDTATVPVSVDFEGDTFYLPSHASATVLLEYYTGRAYGLAAEVNVPLLPIEVPPTPDTGPVRTADASSTDTPCTAEVDTILLTADALCPNVTTALAPGTSRARSTVDETTIGIPGIPAIVIRGVAARSTSTCGSGGSATGTTNIAELRIAGQSVTVPTEPNSEIDLPGVGKLVINEQLPVQGAEHGLTVNAVHLSTTGDLADVVVASATSDVHNCAS